MRDILLCAAVGFTFTAAMYAIATSREPEALPLAVLFAGAVVLWAVYLAVKLGR